MLKCASVFLIVRPLHDVHEIKAHESDPVRPSFRQQNSTRIRKADFDEIWFGLAGYPKIVLSNFIQSVLPTWRTFEVGATLLPLNIGP